MAKYLLRFALGELLLRGESGLAVAAAPVYVSSLPSLGVICDGIKLPCPAPHIGELLFD